MKNFDFPIFKTKTEGVTEKFSLEDPVGRRKYFEAKAGAEIEKLRDWLSGNNFVAFLLGPKNSGKGTYTKLFMEAVGLDRVAHISIGDVVRGAHQDLSHAASKKELVEFLKKRYRGVVSIQEICKLILGWGVSTPLLPTEAILALVEREVSRIGRKVIFIDGFPRNLDQISLSLYFRALIGYRDDPDFFVFIDVPEAVIDERLKFRVICPLCQTPRNTKLLRTKEVGYDASKKEFYLICDNPTCQGFGTARMVSKQGDELGIEAIRERIEVDRMVMKTLLELEGVDKIFLRNSVPADKAGEYVDDYEITPAYLYEWDEKQKKVLVREEPWTIKDDSGKDSYSLLPQPVALALIKQLANNLLTIY
ncbi:hypothetical protein A2757_01585 [Candidatus Giovannonibacteria bacterium RIFCSPHIGHO2_01_FULL_48_47]|nr:MAG: hypothetical protein A2757_01585 [Candidatus Giovannonibacteria bacterium RIFCSPHIGHO2_01_FULL_48_47]OGF68900.1 MAG: hypothetical protein A3D61_03130 [Candidatus Giovannonibacteria bacterium RIFCSPHIGHO2_02_FULL_48_15]OGF88529.1 MAG: hypothetical protein A3B26_00060 [Candidatus Giovannonibacteria bacterium RIFCSPLOWO2_01_FULL_48_47]OGF96414.1 MAG: hypothetical protein A2613_02550 [Candidatus Giovannonibacteria bacterium RIFOXYD1_FULL_48_21]HBT81668.1 hypothetical protein [Candidatus Gio